MNKFLLALFVLFFSFSATAQIDEKEKLEQRKEQLQRELSEAKTKLQNEKKKEKSVLKEIAGQDAQIKISEKIISTIAKQARILDDNIYLTQLEINKLNKDLKIMKEDYAKMIVKSYKSRSEQSRFMFVLSSSSFLQAYKRIQYMKQYAGYRKRQAEEIKIKQARLGAAVGELQTNKKEKEVVIVEKTKLKAEADAQSERRHVRGAPTDARWVGAGISNRLLRRRPAERQLSPRAGAPPFPLRTPTILLLSSCVIVARYRQAAQRQRQVHWQQQQEQRQQGSRQPTAASRRCRHCSSRAPLPHQHAE